jgi:hypothetical protein
VILYFQEEENMAENVWVRKVKEYFEEWMDNEVEIDDFCRLEEKCEFEEEIVIDKKKEG